VVILIPGELVRAFGGARCPDRAQIRRTRRFAHCADSCARDRRHDRFRENRTAIALADHPLPVSATTAAELATARLDRDDLESVLRLIWPSMAELHACFSPVPAPTSGPRRRGVQ
jgi:hypothetical protein